METTSASSQSRTGSGGSFSQFLQIEEGGGLGAKELDEELML